MTPGLIICAHDSRYVLGKHYPAKDPSCGYELCGRCGLQWRIGTNVQPFLALGYYKSVFMLQGRWIDQLTSGTAEQTEK